MGRLFCPTLRRSTSSSPSFGTAQRTALSGGEAWPSLVLSFACVGQVDVVTLEVPLHLQRLVELNPPPSSSEFLESLRSSPQDVLQAMGCALHSLLLTDVAEALPGARPAAAAALEGEGEAVSSKALLASQSCTGPSSSSGPSVPSSDPRLVRVRLSDAGPPLALAFLRSNQVTTPPLHSLSGARRRRRVLWG